MSNNQTRTRRAPPVRIILGERVRFKRYVDETIAHRAALAGRTFEQETMLILRCQLGI